MYCNFVYSNVVEAFTGPYEAFDLTYNGELLGKVAGQDKWVMVAFLVNKRWRLKIDGGYQDYTEIKMTHGFHWPLRHKVER